MHLSRSHWQVTAALALLIGSGLLLAEHAGAIADMRETGIPAAMELQMLEKRMQTIKEQNELAELQAALITGSQEEQVQVYVLPDEADAARAIAGLDVVFSYLQKQKQMLSVSPVTVGDLITKESVSVLPLSFTARLTQEGWNKLQLFMQVSGLMTIGDHASDTDIDTLLRLTEDENPASVAALEQFLRTDLLRYSEEPRPFEDQLLRSFSADTTIESVRAFLTSADMQAMRSLLKDLGPSIRSAKLWPLRFMQLQKADVQMNDDGTVEVDITIGAMGRVR
jgi:hypothetical protein